MLQRILKMIAALSMSIGLNLILQFLLPPAFIHYYGVKRYGEWLVLSATVSYLGTLNFGITTYASNQLTMLRKRGEMEGYKELQGSTLAMLLGMIGIGLAIISSAFFLPLPRLLHLSTMGPTDAMAAVFFLGLLAMTNIFAGYYNNLFLVVERAHTGSSWSTARVMSSTLVCVPLAMLRVNFSVIALFQFSAALVVTAMTIVDLKRRLGDLPLGLSGANWKTVKLSFAPSGMFAMIFSQQFLLFQAPVIMLNWLIGSEAVVLFSISRTILSTARWMLQMITNAIAPEITLSFAERNMSRLLNIFHYSEKVVFALIPVVNLGAFLASPLLLAIWLHKPSLFDPKAYALMALVSSAMSMREHKQFFQFSTNTHQRLSVIVFFGNILMIAVSIPCTMKFGLYGFMVVWLVSEVSQMGLIYHENKKLFNNDASISFFPVIKLALVMATSLPICFGLVDFARARSLLLVGVVAIVGTLLLGVETYSVFDIRSVWGQFWMRMRKSAPVELTGG